MSNHPGTNRPIEIAPSVLPADFARLGEEVAALEARVSAWHRSVAAAEASIKASTQASADEIVRP